MTINDLMAALVAELAEGEVPAPLTESFTLATVWADLARLAGEPLPVAVAAVVDDALAAEFLAENDPPHTLRGMWARWAPLNEQVAPPRQIGIPPWLPLGAAE